MEQGQTGNTLSFEQVKEKLQGKKLKEIIYSDFSEGFESADTYDYKELPDYSFCQTCIHKTGHKCLKYYEGFKTRGGIYYGQMLNNKRWGIGVQIYNEFQRQSYEGYWVDDYPKGGGRFNNPYGVYVIGDLEIINLIIKSQSAKIFRKGKLIYEGAIFYSQSFKCGAHGNGIMYPMRKHFKIIGNFRWGRAHGSAIQIWDDGRTFEGNFENDRFHGYGVYSWSDGSKYQGYWRHGKKHGQGTMINKNGYQTKLYFNEGERYQIDEGTILATQSIKNQQVLDRLMSLGPYQLFQQRCSQYYEKTFDFQINLEWRPPVTFEDGYTYIGQWANDLRWGRGIQFHPYGSFYEGLWIEGKRSLFGRFIDVNGALVGGLWVDGELSSEKVDSIKQSSQYNKVIKKPTLFEVRNGNSMEDGVFYVGEFKKGVKEGQGTGTHTDWFYKGQWKMGQPHGIGRIKHFDGRVYFGQFEKGLPNGYGVSSLKYVFFEPHPRDKQLMKKGMFYKGIYQKTEADSIIMYDTNFELMAPPPFYLKGVSHKSQSINLGQYILMVARAEGRIHYRLMKSIIYRLVTFINYCQQNNLNFNLQISKIFIFTWDEIHFKFKQTENALNYLNQLLSIIIFMLTFEYKKVFEYSEEQLSIILFSASNFYGPQFCSLLKFLYLNRSSQNIDIIEADEFIDYTNTQNQHNEVHYYFIEDLVNIHLFNKYSILSDPKSVDKQKLKTLISRRKYDKPNPEFVFRDKQDHRYLTYCRYVQARKYLNDHNTKSLLDLGLNLSFRVKSALMANLRNKEKITKQVSQQEQNIIDKEDEE